MWTGAEFRAGDFLFSIINDSNFQARAKRQYHIYTQGEAKDLLGHFGTVGPR
jgi:hypothetical protein